MMRFCPRPGNAGFALATVVVVLTTITLMVTGVFLLAFSEYRLGAATVALLQARLAAESGLGSIAATPLEEPGENQGDAAVPQVSGSVGGGRFETRSLSFGPLFFLVESMGLDPSERARHVVAEIWESRPVDLGVRSSLAIRDGPAPEDWQLITDDDADGEGGDCPSTVGLSETISVRVEPAGVIPAGPDFAYLVDRADLLVRSETVVFPGPSFRSDRSCDTADPENWGDPTQSGGACSNYFPMVHSNHDLKVVGGMGQGILFVEGNLEVSGGFEFSGVVIVAGRLTSGESGVRVVGSVIAESVDFWESSRRNLTSVVFSPCAVQRALQSHLIPGPLPRRAWVGPN